MSSLAGKRLVVAGWLVGWLVGCLVVWLFGCLVVWLFGCLVVWLFGCLVVWLFGCLVVWLLFWTPSDEKAMCIFTERHEVIVLVIEGSQKYAASRDSTPKRGPKNGGETA